MKQAFKNSGNGQAVFFAYPWRTQLYEVMAYQDLLGEYAYKLKFQGFYVVHTLKVEKRMAK